MKKLGWVDRLVVEAIHLDQVREHGGLAGLRDKEALEVALVRPRNKWHYEEGRDLPSLAAAYGFGLSRNHPFRDGNTRVSFVVMAVFLELNGMRLTADDTSVVTAMVALAAGRLDEKELADWIRRNVKRVRGR